MKNIQDFNLFSLNESTAPRVLWHFFEELDDVASLGIFKTREEAIKSLREEIDGLVRDYDLDREQLREIMYIEPIDLSDRKKVTEVFSSMIFPPIDRGEKWRAAQLIQEFIRLGADPSLISLIPDTGVATLDQLLKSLEKIFGPVHTLFLQIFKDSPELLKRYSSNLVRKNLF